MAKVIVLINGAPGSGKSTLAQAVEHYKSCVHIDSFAAPLRRQLVSFIQSELGITPPPYAESKKLDIYGRTGRQWMIEWGLAGRRLDENMWAKALVARLDHVWDANVFVIDDLGFASEHQYLTQFTHDNPEYRVFTVYLGSEYWLPAVASSGLQLPYNHYEQFDNDSRICLRNYARLTNPSIAKLLTEIEKELAS